jgi:hypothetical protein
MSRERRGARQATGPFSVEILRIGRLIEQMDNALMNLTTFLPSLITGLVTGIIALSGVVYTQHQAASREDARWTREGDRLDETRELERRHWAREHRREAHLKFLAEQRRLDHWMMMYTRVGLEGVETPEEDWLEPLGRLLIDVQIFGSQASAVAAARVLRATKALESGETGRMMEADQALEEYRRLVQRDLELDETHLPPWGSEDDPEWIHVGRISD